MSHESVVPSDPFKDPPVTNDPREDVEESTLVVGREASLTLGTDSLIVLDEAIPPKKSSRLSNCCDFLLTRPATLTTHSIPFYNVLWASLNEYDLTIYHAHPLSANIVQSKCIAYPITKTDRAKATLWIERLLDKSYGASRRQKRIKLLVNPFGGKGSAQKWFTRHVEPIFRAANCQLDVERTQYSGHAVKIAQKLDIDKYDIIACCSGDGLPHEVFNGLGLKPDAARALANIAVVQVPCGSGNAMSLNLNGTDSPSVAALAVIKGLSTPLDLVSVVQGERRSLSFLSQAFGIVAETDLGTENLRWMGDLRFTYGFLVRILGKTTYPCDVAFKVVEESKSAIRDRYRQYRVDGSSSLPDPEHSDLLTPQPQAPTPPASAGLPPLRYGDLSTPLPTTWTALTPYPNMGNFYAGNMPWMARDTNFFQAALPADGTLDLVCINGDCSPVAALRCLIAAGTNKLFDLPNVEYRKVQGYRIVPRPRLDAGGFAKKISGDKGGGWGVSSRLRRLARLLGLKRWGALGEDGKVKEQGGYISIDGESVPFEAFQVEVHRGLGTVLSRNGRLFEAPVLE